MREGDLVYYDESDHGLGSGLVYCVVFKKKGTSLYGEWFKDWAKALSTVGDGSWMDLKDCYLAAPKEML